MASSFILGKKKKSQLEKCYSNPGKFRNSSTTVYLNRISKIQSLVQLPSFIPSISFTNGPPKTHVAFHCVKYI